MNTKSSSHGYILVLTFMILALSTLLVTQIVYQAGAHIYFDRTMIAREKAKLLAQSGNAIAFSKLIFCKKLKPDKPKDQFLLNNYPSFNQKQEFSLKESIDGIDAQIAITLMSEEGKININQLFDFKEKKFKNEGKQNDARKFLQQICTKIQEILPGKDLFKGLEKSLKERSAPLEDVTELLAIPEFAQTFKALTFYMPERIQKDKRPVFLTDIFTTWTTSEKINAAYLSESLLAILNMRGAQYWDTQKRKELITRYLKDQKPPSELNAVWDTYFKPSYGKEFKNLTKDFEPFFMIDFEPSVFSILTYATVGTVTQRIFAIVKKQKIGEREECSLMRLYWL